MKYIVFSILLCISFDLLAQSNHPLNDSVTFVAVFKMSDASKDGFYINGYVVNIDYSQAKKLNGKTINISGKVITVQAIKPNTPPAQGRSINTYYIPKPIIKILNQ
jgi:hypothetical protein